MQSQNIKTLDPVLTPAVRARFQALYQLDDLLSALNGLTAPLPLSEKLVKDAERLKRQALAQLCAEGWSIMSPGKDGRYRLHPPAGYYRGRRAAAKLRRVA